MNSNNLSKFWKKKSKIIYWKKNPKKILFNSNGRFKFYNDGLTNVTYNCIQKNIKQGLGNKIAIVLIDEDLKKIELTYNNIENLINHFIKIFLKKFNLKKLKRNIVAIHSSANLCSLISMLSCAKLGITHSVFFEDLSIEAIKIRCKILNTNILITSCNDLDFKNKIKKINLGSKLNIFRFVKKSKYKPDILFNDLLLLKNKTLNVRYSFFKSNHPLFVLFTSGSTGEPKGIVHSTGGYLVYIKFTCSNKFGVNKQSIMLTASDPGWINGHSYSLYGPLSLGACCVLIEKPSILINPEILKKLLLSEKISILYLPVTLIRLIKAVKNKLRINSTHLKILGSMGEPLSKFVAQWFSVSMSKKKLQIVNTYFQTETGGIISSPGYKDSVKDVPFGTVGKPLSKYLNLILTSNKKKSEIKIGNPWPGCMIDVINKDLFKKYWDEQLNFNLFDFASLDNKKNFIIHGRTDDVINIRGHRIGSGEIEAILLSIPEIKEVCAISVDDDLEGASIFIFLSRKNNKIFRIEKKVNDKIIKNFGNYALPKKIIILSELPKTRSGKILRRLLRVISKNPKIDKLGDLSTILNKKVVYEIKKKMLLN